MHCEAPARLYRVVSMFITTIAFAFYAVIVVAQSGTTGTLTGVVKDPNGANLAGVSVAIRNVGTVANRTTTTDEGGHWAAPALPVGTYEVTYEITGFKKLVRGRVEVKVSKC